MAFKIKIHQHNYVRVRNLMNETYDDLKCIECDYTLPVPRNDEQE